MGHTVLWESETISARPLAIQLKQLPAYLVDKQEDRKKKQPMIFASLHPDWLSSCSLSEWEASPALCTPDAITWFCPMTICWSREQSGWGDIGEHLGSLMHSCTRSNCPVQATTRRHSCECVMLVAVCVLAYLNAWKQVKRWTQLGK